MGATGVRARRAAAVAWAAAAVLVLAGCPHEADDSREVRFSVTVTYEGRFPRDPDRQRLVVGTADVKALGVENPVSFADFGSFVISTSTITEGDATFTHCLADPIVISDADTGEVDHTVPAGTCLEERRPLRVP